MLLAATLAILQNGPQIDWTSAEVTYGGEAVTVRRGTLEVPENYEAPERRLKLPVVALPAKSGATGSPIVFLHGGPGGSGLGWGESEIGAKFFTALREAGEVIVFDQRGGGQSQPRLVAPLSRPLPQDFLLSYEKFNGYLVEEAKVAGKAFVGKADIASYTTVENANDLDQLRSALRAQKIRIVAHSYGTHLAQAYLKQFPDKVESAVLMGTEGLAMTVKLPSTYKSQIDELTKLIANHPNTKLDVPNFGRLLQMAAQRLDREPLTIKHNGQDFPIGGFGFLWLLRWDIGDTADLPLFPRIAQAAFQGNVQPLVPMFRKRFASMSAGFPVVSFAMDEASGADPERLALVAKEAEGFFFAPVVNMGIEGLGEHLGGKLLGPEFRQPVRTGVPTLFISGTLDSNTPPAQAEEVRRTFSRSWHLVLRNGGHEDYLWNADAIKETVSFLKTSRSQTRTINLPVPEFLPILK